MKITKKNQILQKRNLELSEQLKEAEFKYAQLRDLNSESAKQAKQIIQQIDEIRNKWEHELAALQEQRKKYESLNDKLLKQKRKLIRRSQLFIRKLISRKEGSHGSRL